MPSSPALPVVIDLFSGAGGLSLGASRAGFFVAAAVENDPQAYEVHALNFPSSRHLNRDVATLTGDELLRLSGIKDTELDGLMGGPPCQGFSIMGPRNAGDERNELFGTFFRLVAETQPKFYLAENVPNILSSEYAQIVALALSQVHDNYMCLPPFVVKASDYGAPTSRERVLFVGVRRDLGCQLTQTDFDPPIGTVHITVREALFGLPRRISPAWQNEIQGLRKVKQSETSEFGQLVTGRIPQGVGHPIALEELRSTNRAFGSLGTRHSPKIERRFAALRHGEKDCISKSVRLDPSKYCPTLRAGTSKDKGSFQAVRPIHPTQSRVITPREAARLQGFPDWFVFHATKWHSFRQIGNSVSPILAEKILRVFATRLNEWSASHTSQTLETVGNTMQVQSPRSGEKNGRSPRVS